MHVKIEIEDAPEAVNRALADSGEDGSYGTSQLVEEVLLVALRARTNQMQSDLVEMEPAYTADLLRHAGECMVIEEYRAQLPHNEAVPATTPDPDPFTPEQRAHLTEWVAIKVSDQVSMDGVGGVLGAIDRWSPLLRRMCAGERLTGRDVADLRAIAKHWRDVYKEVRAGGLEADKKADAADHALAVAILGAIEEAARVSVDA